MSKLVITEQHIGRYNRLLWSLVVNERGEKTDFILNEYDGDLQAMLKDVLPFQVDMDRNFDMTEEVLEWLEDHVRVWQCWVSTPETISYYFEKLVDATFFKLRWVGG